MQDSLAVFLLSYNRRDYAIQAIDSLLAQDGEKFTLVISENSPGDEVFHALEKHIKNHHNPHNHKIEFIRRRPSLASLEHFNTILAEAKKFTYVMLFHDDDVLRPGALKKMKQALLQEQKLAAVSCNAYILQQDTLTDKLFNPNLKNNLQLNHTHDLILHYLRPQLSHTPFPSYLYRSENLKYQLNTDDGGKHSDVSFLVKTLETGPFLWLAEPLMYYRRHGLNDSKNVDLADTLKISLFYLKKSPELFHWIFIFNMKSVLKYMLNLIFRT